MNNVTPIGVRTPTPAQLALIKGTVAKDTTTVEFDHFMHTASRLGLDPLRKQIIAIVFNKNDDARRNMTIIVTQEGQRVIAERSGTYGPERTAPEYTYDPEAKSDLNPLGLVSARVTLWRKYGPEWQPVMGEAYWDEFAPIDEEWDWQDCDDGKRRRKPTGKKKLADNWARMGRLMLAKAARAQALRAGWPDDFSGLYTEEEMQKAVVLDNATALLADYAEAERLSRVNYSKDMLAFIFDPRDQIVMVSRDAIREDVNRWLHDKVTHPAQIKEFRRMNQQSLQTYWAWETKEALNLKRDLEQREEELAAKMGAESAE